MSICQVVTQTTTYFPAATAQHCSFCCSMIVIYSIIRSWVQCFCNIDAVFTHIYPSYTNNRYWLTYACWGYQWIIDLLISLLEPSITLTQTQMQKLELMKETLIVWLLFKNGFTFQITTETNCWKYLQENLFEKEKWLLYKIILWFQHFQFLNSNSNADWYYWMTASETVYLKIIKVQLLPSVPQ